LLFKFIIISALSILQNGKLPKFLTEQQLDELFNKPSALPYMLAMRKGLMELGIYQVCEKDLTGH